VHNPDHVTHHVQQILLDGQVVSNGSIPLAGDQQQHRVVVTMAMRSASIENVTLE